LDKLICDIQAEALAKSPPLPGVPLQIRNAPTKLMKKLGYGKEYSYNPRFAHPVHNVSEYFASFKLVVVLEWTSTCIAVSAALSRSLQFPPLT
jgi:hypothetical protein